MLIINELSVRLALQSFHIFRLKTFVRIGVAFEEALALGKYAASLPNPPLSGPFCPPRDRDNTKTSLPERGATLNYK